MKKGYTILLDSIIALTFALLIMSSLIGIRQTGSSLSESTIKRLHYTSEDTLDALNKKGVLDYVGEEWAAADGNRSSDRFWNANRTVTEYLEQLLPPNVGYQLTIDDDVVAENLSRLGLDESTSMTHSTRLLVGYGKGLPTRGNVARAVLTNIREKETSSYTYFGGFVGQGNITVFVRDIPADASNIRCCLELNTPSAFNLYINDAAAGSFSPSGSGDMAANLRDNRSAGCPAVSGDGSGCVASCSSLIQRGADNKFDLMFTNSDLNKQYVGGGFLHVVYGTNIMDTDEVVKTSRYYFPGINGTINLYDSFYVPGILESMNALVHYKSNYSVFLNIGDITVYNTSAGNVSAQNVTLTTSQFDALPFIKSTGGGQCESSKCISLNTVPLRFATGNISQTSVLDIVLVNDRSGSMNQSGWTLTSGILPARVITNVSVPLNAYSMVFTFTIPNGTQRLAAAINWTDVPGFPGSDASEFVVNLRRPNGTWIFEYPGTPNLASGKVDPPYGIGQANEYYSGISTKPQTVYVENPANGTWGVAVYGWNLRPKPPLPQPATQNVTIIIYNGTSANLVRNPTVLSINSAMTAARSFVDSMEATDRGAYVVFGSYAAMLQNLTFNKTALKAAINNTGLEGGTYVNLGIDNASVHLRNRGRAGSTKVMILLTDGQNDMGPTPALDAAAAAKGNGTVIFAIGMTGFANQAMLQQIASRPEYYYYTPDGSGLSAIYSQISDVITSDYRIQTVNITGDFVKSILYPDSYIEFDYVPINQSSYGEISLKRSTCRFNDVADCRGNLTIPPAAVVSDAKVTSYSGQYWTNYLGLGNSAGTSTIYQLSNWFTGSYLPLGDPYMVNIPADRVQSGESNIVTVGTGYNASESAGCSADDRAIYTLRMHTLAGYGDVFAQNVGCNWTIQFEDDTTFKSPMPSSYNGTNKCFYTNASISYTKDDATNDAMYRLLSQLDLDKNGKVDLLFDPTMVDFELSDASGVQSLWGPAKFKLIMWI